MVETLKAPARLKLPIRSFLVCPVTVKFEAVRLFWPISKAGTGSDADPDSVPRARMRAGAQRNCRGAGRMGMPAYSPTWLAPVGLNTARIGPVESDHEQLSPDGP